MNKTTANYTGIVLVPVPNYPAIAAAKVTVLRRGPDGKFRREVGRDEPKNDER